jgi:hypothetical protein
MMETLAQEKRGERIRHQHRVEGGKIHKFYYNPNEGYNDGGHLGRTPNPKTIQENSNRPRIR